MQLHIIPINGFWVIKKYGDDKSYHVFQHLQHAYQAARQSTDGVVIIHTVKK